jgi:tRNA (guanine10-N2)-methyltransferase
MFSVLNFAHKPTAHFGALMFGSDIDGRQMRGKGKLTVSDAYCQPRCVKQPQGNPPGVIRAATQYGTASRIVDLCTFDVTRNPWRCGALFDAIVTDPPCKNPQR